VEIKIDVTNEQLAIISRKIDSDTFYSQVMANLTGLVAWYLDEGRQVIEAEEKAVARERVDLIVKLNPEDVAKVDEIIGYPVISKEPVVLVKGV